MVDNELVQWFAMRATFGRNMKVKHILDSKSIESFIPMKYVIQRRSMISKRELVPVVKDLIFVHASKNDIQTVKDDIDFFQYITRPASDGTNKVIVVPDYQMQEFIMVSKTNSEKLIYFMPNEIDFVKGDMVRIHGGVFDGRVAVLSKIKNKKKKHLIIEIEGSLSIAVEQESGTFFEKI